ncbi:trans-sulfuration enzyme family protein [Acanthopleuribacter pedis]|uniref:Aminotransferase class V-fold PLP-dependent enzyme n=1 Tax=Acanthopleuribacter pedis TaxID=442870 RepID=A0A8J7U7G1_9BACT|nr:aminotransferase class I/II-fold pyridoxal phosphate-dependent enzyme [Acanthopleuribacter pedis]MBO1322964.1 aminotransferase class V-fold PLP-dependent enzyme [Acanthopleuribacter pedis]
MGFSTDCVHAGQWIDPHSGAVMVPIYQTSTYQQQGIGKHKGYEYARTQNPTRQALEDNVAALEKGACGFAFASGMAAINALMSLFEAGDHFIVTGNTYGGTFRLFDRILRKFGLTFTFVDTSNLDAVKAAIKPETKMMFVETPTNPMLTLTDIKAVAAVAKENNILLCVDNTFATPYRQRPIELGADFVNHSTTKYLNGHSDCVGGVLVAKDESWREKIHFVQNSAGAILGPMDSWLTLRGIKTLAVRMDRHESNGRAVAKALTEMKGVGKVIYPGLDNYPQRELALSQMGSFGAMVSFTVENQERAEEVLTRFKLFSLAESLGGVESLVCHPATMTHAAVPAEARAELGISDGLIRLSVGIEDEADLIADLVQAVNG